MDFSFGGGYMVGRLDGEILMQRSLVLLAQAKSTPTTPPTTCPSHKRKVHFLPKELLKKISSSQRTVLGLKLRIRDLQGKVLINIKTFPRQSTPYENSLFFTSLTISYVCETVYSPTKRFFMNCDTARFAGFFQKTWSLLF